MLPWLSSEVLSPHLPEFGAVEDAARRLVLAGARRLFVPDAPGGRPGVDAITTAAHLQENCGIDAIPHLNCRDRNAVALQSAFLTAIARGLGTIKAVTGDPTGGAAIFELRSTGLVRELRSWSARLGIPCTVVVGHRLQKTESGASIDRLKEKIELGADRIVLTPCLDATLIADLLDRLGTIEIPVVASLMLITSPGVLDRLTLDAGFAAPEGLVGRLAAASDAAAALAIALDAALAVVSNLGARIQGIHVVPPFGNPVGAVALLEGSQRAVALSVVTVQGGGPPNDSQFRRLAA